MDEEAASNFAVCDSSSIRIGRTLILGKQRVPQSDNLPTLGIGIINKGKVPKHGLS